MHIKLLFSVASVSFAFGSRCAKKIRRRSAPPRRFAQVDWFVEAWHDWRVDFVYTVYTAILSSEREREKKRTYIVSRVNHCCGWVYIQAASSTVVFFFHNAIDIVEKWRLNDCGRIGWMILLADALTSMTFRSSSPMWRTMLYRYEKRIPY